MESPRVIPLETPGTSEIILHMAFAPLHKRALGMAVGSVTGLVIFAITMVHVIVQPVPAPNLSLLAEYFYGYTETLGGAFVGLAWGFFVGFVGGWFLAFCRNLALATSIFITRTRAELHASRDFLDHI